MIRNIKDEDIEMCLSWYNRYITDSVCTFETDPLSLSAFKQRVHGVIAQYPWLVLEEEGELKGYAYLSHFNDRAAYDWTADVSVYVAPDKHGKGYGYQLLNALITEAENRGFKQLVSIIAQGNISSEHLHEKCGFQRIAFFDHIGYKKGKWLGVSYWTYRITSEFEDVPVHPAMNNQEESDNACIYSE